jgi:hypothetical protein
MNLKDLVNPVQETAVVTRSDKLLTSQALSYVQKHEKGIKVDIHIEYGNYVLLKAAETIDRLRIDPSLKWFSIGAEELRAGCLSLLRDMYPFAVIEFSIDHLITALINEPRKTRGFLEMLNGLGIRRFSVKWQHYSRQREVVSLLNKWGLEAHVDDVGDFMGFLQSTFFSPHSLTVNPSSAEWRYFDYTDEEEHFEDPSLKRIA